jgi:hypothetical protein
MNVIFNVLVNVIVNRLKVFENSTSIHYRFKDSKLCGSVEGHAGNEIIEMVSLWRPTPSRYQARPALLHMLIPDEKK